MTNSSMSWPSRRDFQKRRAIVKMLNVTRSPQNDKDARRMTHVIGRSKPQSEIIRRQGAIGRHGTNYDKHN